MAKKENLFNFAKLSIPYAYECDKERERDDC